MKVRTVMLSLEGDAFQLHQYYSNSMGGLLNLNWEDYLKELKKRFTGQDEEDFMSALVQLKQEESVSKYYQDFIRTLNLIQIPTQHVLSIFLSNLKPEIK